MALISSIRILDAGFGQFSSLIADYMTNVNAGNENQMKIDFILKKCVNLLLWKENTQVKLLCKINFQMVTY